MQTPLERRPTLAHGLIALALVACGGPTPLPAPAPLPLPADGPGADERTGRLVYEPIEPVKSVRAYLGDELRLATPTGELVLAPTEAVPREALIAAAGRDIALVCAMRPVPPPDPNTSYPVGPDGAPLARPEVCEVRALRVPTPASGR
jgi:hypothetical protein